MIIEKFTCYKQHEVNLVDRDGILLVEKTLSTTSKTEKEIEFYTLLKDWEHIPKLIDYDIEKKQIVLEYVGQALTVKFKPKDRYQYKARIRAVVEDLEAKYGVYHNDIRWKNIVLSDDDKLYLIDWERAQYKNIERDPEWILGDKH